MQINALSSGQPSAREDLLPQIAWYEGLQLLPQHFQLLDARLDSLFRRQMLAVSPYSWGLDWLDLDEAALAAGMLRVSAVSGQFPDGLVFSWDARQGAVIECALPPEMNENPVRYALAVPIDSFREGGVKVGRYRQSVGVPVVDLTNPDEKAAITRWVPNLSIRPWDPLSAHYVQLPFAEVIKTATGFELNGFHPAAVRLLPNSACAKQVTNVIQLLRAKAKQLNVPALPAALPSDHSGGLNWVMGGLIAGVPRLEAQLMSGAGHPYDIFLSLCSIAGMVAAFSGKVPDCFPAYDHANPVHAISSVATFILDTVARIGVDQRAINEVLFTQIEGGWIGVIPPQAARVSELLLRVKFGGRHADNAIAAWLDHTLICFDTDENRCREMRVRGLARREHAAVPELGLTAMPDQRYVQVSLPLDFDPVGRRLLLRGPEERATVTVESVSLIVQRGG